MSARVVVTGGRDHPDRTYVWAALTAAHAAHPIVLVITGGATGVDDFAGQWARVNKIELVVHPADWKQHGRRAGPLRNQLILDTHHPDVVLAFHGGRGTTDMVRRAKRAGIPVVDCGPGSCLPFRALRTRRAGG